MSTFSPKHDYILVEENDSMSQTESNLHIPKGATDEEIKFGTVVSVGPGAYENGERTPIDFESGDDVVWKGFSETTVRYKGEEFTLVKNEAIIATIEE